MLSQDVLVELPPGYAGSAKLLIHPAGVITLLDGQKADIIFDRDHLDELSESLELNLIASGLCHFIQSVGREYEFDAAYTSKRETGPELNRLFALFELKE